MTQALPDQITPSSQVLFQEIDGEGVLLHLEEEAYYGLSEVGARMWQLLSECTDMNQVVARLLEEFEVDEATLRRDLAKLVAEMSEAGLLAAEA